MSSTPLLLGQTITVTSDKEIQRRIALVWQAFGRTSSVFISKLPIFLQRKVYSSQCILQWCQFMLSIGGNNLQFTPISPCFEHWGGMKLDDDFFHVSKLSEDKRSSPKTEELLSPNISEDPKKGLDRKLKRFCPRNLVKTKNELQISASAQMHTIVKLFGGGGCSCRPQSNYWGDAVNLLGDISPQFPPPSPGFGTPA